MDLEGAEGMERDAVIEALQGAGIGVVVNYRPIHLTQYFMERFGYRPGTFPNAEAIGEMCISLPFYPLMPNEDVSTVVGALREILGSAEDGKLRRTRLGA